MAIFHCYVSSPEGNLHISDGSRTVPFSGLPKLFRHETSWPSKIAIASRGLEKINPSFIGISMWVYPMNMDENGG